MCIFYAIKIKVNNYNGIMFQAKLNFQYIKRHIDNKNYLDENIKTDLIIIDIGIAIGRIKYY